MDTQSSSPRGPTGGPASSVDLFSDEVLDNPYPTYEQLREMGGAVWLSKLQMFVLTRYEDVRATLRDAASFTSSKGVMMNERMNETLRGIVLCSDDPEHSVMRKVLMGPLAPNELRALRERIVQEAEALVSRLVARGSFDAATDLARHLPVTIVSDLVGLPEAGRERMLEWAAANFDCFGPMNQRTLNAFPTVEEMVRYAFSECVPGKLKPDGWAARIWQAADRGEIRHEQCPIMMNDYMGPSLDTTIFATGSLIALFAEHPDQWDLVRQRKELIPGAVNEAIRLESPIQNFSRVAAKDIQIDGTRIPTGSRVIVSYGAANRDPRKWKLPDRFDVQRSAVDHLGFGHGTHHCLGNNLARLEISCLLEALVSRVQRFELRSAERQLNNVLRGWRKLEVTVH